MALCGCGIGAPADCTIRKVAVLHVREIGGLPIVDVVINGKPVTMIADTGAERSLLTTAAVAQLGLPPDIGRLSQTIGIGGPSTAWDVKLADLVIGGVRFPVNRMAVAEFTIPSPDHVSPVGLLGADILLAFDVDIDLSADTITLYGARRCPDARPPWTEPAVPIRQARRLNDRILIPMKLDGQQAVGLLDTGAQRTTIGSALAARLGLDQAALAADRTIMQNGAGPSSVMSHLHRFSSLSIGPTVTKDAELPVMLTDFGIGDALVGQDFLRGRRVWISFATTQVYVTQMPGDNALDAGSAE